MNRTLRVFETFSGIGSQRRSLDIVKSWFANFDFEIVATCDWYISAILAYDAIHSPNSRFKASFTPVNPKVDLSPYSLSTDSKNASNSTFSTLSPTTKAHIKHSIITHNNFLDIKTISVEAFSALKVDLLTYSFPCQDLSPLGNYSQGLSGKQSSLLYEIKRLLITTPPTSLPQFLLMENVPSLLDKNHKSSFDEWLQTLNDLNYSTYYFVINSKDTGHWQERRRLFALSILNAKTLNLPALDSLDSYYEFIKSKMGIETSNDILRLDYRVDPFYQEAKQARLKRNKTADILLKHSLVLNDSPKLKTLLTNQYRHPNAGIVKLIEGDLLYNDDPNYHNYRLLTARECWLAMGFTDSDFDRAKDANVGYWHLYRLAGNAICIRSLLVMMLIVKQIWTANGFVV